MSNIDIMYRSSLLHRAFRRITLIINQQMHYIAFHIKTLKMSPTCFDPKIILKEICCSLRMILGSEQVGAILSVLIWNVI